MTNKISISFSKILIGLVLGIAMAVTISAQTQTLSGVIRVPKAFGIVPAGPGNSQAAFDPCGQFYVAVLDPAKGNRPLAVSDTPIVKGFDQGNFYTCKFRLTVPANKPLYAIASMGGSLLLPKEDRDPTYITEAWIGGTNNKPPRGYERGFAGHFVTLGTVKGTYLHFDMYYARVDPN